MFSRVVVICLFAFVSTVVIATPPPIEDKPLDCPDDEEYYRCTLELCSKNCVDLKNPPPCLPLAPGCYAPGCECKVNFLRNAEGVCVSTDYCS